MASDIQTKGILFEAVQSERVFNDSKTFVDSISRIDPDLIMHNFEIERHKPGFDLRGFVLHNFILPKQYEDTTNMDLVKNTDMKIHIDKMWDILSRDSDKPEDSSLIPLPHPYIVPGGRFREIYYWDSYFAALGLKVSNRMDIIENMVKNFVWLIETYGHIPNGNRTYYLSRSQPPFFTMLVELMEKTSPADIIEYLPAVEKEYLFWMDGKEQLKDDIIAVKRVVLTESGNILNRYWDENDTPREESFIEDLHLAEKIPIEMRRTFFRNIRAACESGWDFSSRWLKEGKNLETIRTTEIIPIDLNCLIYHMESFLSRTYKFKGEAEKAKEYKTLADSRKNAIEKFFWDENKGFYFDMVYDQKKLNSTGIWSLAGFFPLTLEITENSDRINRAARTLLERFDSPGGFPTTLNKTSQQWDYPNGWAPLQWMIINGLEKNGFNNDAKQIAIKFINLVQSVFDRTGRMMEKYNVCDMNLEAGGGEYRVQEGFGWTNGVIIALIKRFTDRRAYCSNLL